MPALAAMPRLRRRLVATATRTPRALGWPARVARARGSRLRLRWAAVVTSDHQVGIARIAFLGALLKVGGHVLRDFERCGMGLDLDRADLSSLDAASSANVGHESRRRGAFALAPVDEEADEVTGRAPSWAAVAAAILVATSLFLSLAWASVVSRGSSTSAVAIATVGFVLGSAGIAGSETPIRGVQIDGADVHRCTG